jgi:hypothetical protein
MGFEAFSVVIQAVSLRSSTIVLSFLLAHEYRKFFGQSFFRRTGVSIVLPGWKATQTGHTTRIWISVIPLTGAALVAISRTTDFRRA